jgi:hypothetical protein
MLAVQLLLRSNQQWIYIDPLLNIGCRNDKHYFLVEYQPNQTKFIAQLIQKGPSCTLVIEDEGVRRAVQEVLLNIVVCIWFYLLNLI